MAKKIVAAVQQFEGRLAGELVVPVFPFP